MTQEMDLSADVSGNTGYEADDIQVLEGLVAVRKDRVCTLAAQVALAYII